MDEFVEKAAKTLTQHGRRAAVIARSTRWAVKRAEPVRPVFVVGCSRAGTTLVYKTLSESHELGSLQKETHDFWERLHPIADRGWISHALEPSDIKPNDHAIVSRHFYLHTGKRRFVDKNNQNGLCVNYLAELFLDSIFVFITRNPGDNIHSLMQGWRKPAEFGTWSKQLPLDVKIEQGKINRWCFFLPNQWRKHISSSLAEVCAYQYCAINKAIIDAREQLPPKRFVQLRYEDVLRDPVESFRLVFESVDIPFSQTIQDHCKHVLTNPYNAFSEIGAGKWRKSTDVSAIEQVLPSTVPIARILGY